MSTQLEINLLNFEALEYTPYLPVMAPMDFHVFAVKFDNFHELSVAVHNIVAGYDRKWYEDTFKQKMCGVLWGLHREELSKNINISYWLEK